MGAWPKTTLSQSQCKNGQNTDAVHRPYAYRRGGTLALDTRRRLLCCHYDAVPNCPKICLVSDRIGGFDFYVSFHITD